MSHSEPSKYAENQFLSATATRYPLMTEILNDTKLRATIATQGIPGFNLVMSDLDSATQDWNLGETAIANAEAYQLSATPSIQNKMASITHKPDADTNSVLEGWDSTIRSQVAYQGPTYVALLPHGRDTVTRGSVDDQITAIHDLGIRLSEVAGKPVLHNLGTNVIGFSEEARLMRMNQINAKAALEVARQGQEARRVTAANCIYALIGQGMAIWSYDPLRVDTLWNVNILRHTAQSVPDAPLDTTWDAATRTLATTAMPTGATRLEAWRVGPGAMPELLLTAGFGVTQIIIPATITFTPGELYQLWLVGVNSKGRSAAGPVQNWTAG